MQRELGLRDADAKLAQQALHRPRTQPRLDHFLAVLILRVGAARLVFLYSEQQKAFGEGALLMERWSQGACSV